MSEGKGIEERMEGERMSKSMERRVKVMKASEVWGNTPTMPKEKEVKIILADEVKQIKIPQVNLDYSAGFEGGLLAAINTSKIIKEEMIINRLEWAKWVLLRKAMQELNCGIEPLDLSKAQAAAIIDYIAGGEK